jgi:hypothetical protein
MSGPPEPHGNSRAAAAPEGIELMPLRLADPSGTHTYIYVAGHPSPRWDLYARLQVAM